MLFLGHFLNNVILSFPKTAGGFSPLTLRASIDSLSNRGPWMLGAWHPADCSCLCTPTPPSLSTEVPGWHVLACTQCTAATRPVAFPLYNTCHLSDLFIGPITSLAHNDPFSKAFQEIIMCGVMLCFFLKKYNIILDYIYLHLF